MNDIKGLFTKTYAAFNARDIEAVLAVMDPDVDWPNGMEGGRVIGHDQVRRYWTRQWSMIDPSVTPERFATEEDGRVAVDVHQVVRDLEGNRLALGGKYYRAEQSVSTMLTHTAVPLARGCQREGTVGSDRGRVASGYPLFD